MFGASSTTTPGAAGVASVASAPKGFYFKPRRMRLDWLKIGSLNLQRVIDDCDISVLQNNLEHLTFADVTPEDLGYFRDHTNVLKVFRLCQLTMEYLLEVQGELVRAYSDKEAEVSFFFLGPPAYLQGRFLPPRLAWLFPNGSIFKFST